jgi:transposase, IS30 family
MARHLTIEERDHIGQLAHQGWEQREIAKALHRSPATISREQARNSSAGEYLAAQAQSRAERRRSQRPLQTRMDRPEINKAVRRGLTGYWSPEQIAGRLRREFPDQPERHIAPQTIYTWIAAQGEDREHWQSFLRRRGKRPRSRRQNPEENATRSAIADRPAVIEERRRLGDYEGDTVLGPPGAGGLVTLVDRQSRFTIVTKVRCQEARHVHDKIKDRLKPLPEHQRRSVTFDNGTEFQRCPLLEDHLDMRVYWAEPGCPFQRGTNENTNGLVRQFFPKRTDFREVSHSEVRAVENLLNDRPRACLNYQTPSEVFHGNADRFCCD